LIVTTGPGSYTSLRVGISFILGLHFSKKIKVAALSAEDLLKFKIKNNQNLNHGMYIFSGNNQKFICYKLGSLEYKYIKLEEKNIFNYRDLEKLDIIFYNKVPLKNFEIKFKQKKYQIKKIILENLSSIKFNNLDKLKPIYISNNYNLN